jgi:endonuclease/exonuclease/phosphatase family metal-dependent hydrolase
MEISNSGIIRFQRQSDFWKPRWFKPNLQTFQERLGGRIALVSEIDIQGLPYVTYNLHLESRSDDELRLAQLIEVLHDAAAYDTARLAHSGRRSQFERVDTPRIRRLARADFTRAVPTAQVATTPRRHLLEPGRHIDWAFVRGSSQPKAGNVLKSVKASDHYPISSRCG